MSGYEFRLTHKSNAMIIIPTIEYKNNFKKFADLEDIAESTETTDPTLKFQNHLNIPLKI